MPVSWQDPKFNRNFSSENVVYDTDKEDQRKVESFIHIVQMCRDNKIALLFACAPNFGKPTIGFKQRITELAGNNSYVMQYDITNPVYRDADYFTDIAHLKLNGAAIFYNRNRHVYKPKQNIELIVAHNDSISILNLPDIF
jgi:hypothetical protein